MYQVLLFWALANMLCFTSAFASNPQDCIACHQQQLSDWSESDHAKAMAPATKETVLANFNDASISHFSQSAKFFSQNNAYIMEINEAGKKTAYTIAFTFGHYPLQQYLTETENGRYQVLPFAWDSRTIAEGGQRWYPNYALEDVKPNDRLHWKQALQNWNGMCADCHSDGLKRNYSITTNTFETEYDNINVGCQSCHGKMPEHSQQKAATNSLSKQDTQQILSWFLKEGDSVARLVNSDNQAASKQQKHNRQEFMDNCFACHSLRSPLTDGIEANTAFLDQFSPSLLLPNLYFADGQIKEEVYVYGSFLQSKMFAEGVTCLDCHNAHTMKIKTQGNGLCLQCHNSEVYQQQAHIQHPFDSNGGQCVNCHMPETTYMGVDARRDHSFVIPRPHVSSTYNTPNACTQCHQDKDNNWAATHIKSWYKKPSELAHKDEQFLRLQSQYYLPVNELLALANDPQLSVIKRATVLGFLPYVVQQLDDKTAQQWIKSEEPLIRLAIAQQGQLMPESERLRTYATLLNDPLKAIRIAAARNLIGVNMQQSTILQQAFTELNHYDENNSWRGEGNINRSLSYAAQGEISKSIDALKHAIHVDPYFEAAYINLAENYRMQKQAVLENKVLLAGITANPKSATLHYAIGMRDIRAGNKHQAIKAFKQAMDIEPSNPQFAYLYFLALDSVGNTSKALSLLERSIAHYNGNRQLAQLGLSFAQKLADTKRTTFFTRILQGQ